MFVGRICVGVFGLDFSFALLLLMACVSFLWLFFAALPAWTSNAFSMMLCRKDTFLDFFNNLQLGERFMHIKIRVITVTFWS